MLMGAGFPDILNCQQRLKFFRIGFKKFSNGHTTFASGFFFTKIKCFSWLNVPISTQTRTIAVTWLCNERQQSDGVL